MSRPLRAAVPALAVLALLPGAPAWARRAPRPVISSVRCVRSCADVRTVAPGGVLRIAGRGFTRGVVAVFPVTRSGVRHSAPVRVLTRSRLSATVPVKATAGVLYIRDRAGRRSNTVRPVRVVRPVAPARPPASAAASDALDGDGMWIWYVSKSSGGDVQAIVAQARAHGISTVFVKSSDGSTWWPQFSADLVAALKAGGLHVCAWQYVYGTSPESEAQLGAQAVQTGADCLVIDAEKEYEGRYAAAQRYVTALRQAIGPSFPVALTSFPYVDYHPALPYSVFLGPGGAQTDVPQIYWQEIGDGLDNVVNHAYRFNRLYGRPIAPLGQLYNNPPPDQIVRFRELAQAAGSTGVSWWDWQEAQPAGWDAISQPLGPLAPPAPATDDASYGLGGKGDPVIWAQEHLNGAGDTVAVTGQFDAATQQAVQQFQGSRGLPVTGVVDTATWNALLQVAPVMVDWTTTPPPARVARVARRDEIAVHGRG
ncbi:MAG: hypothetical protein E6G10_24440 [Actinobacteria bacterium]|nr:MAG: hypothetical protein E6G10_24440 [Actinomycetota bacterium]